ncbi:EF-hand domain-containing protein [Nocardiopsis sp. NRRL B-16309]|uniref:EF-hand domain-containing protein n=1 Tax=Nocardiopsis sp. NRRL B-16309 TaxID=1519494 RepID=UPI0006ADE0B2|nr:EF-hand domain-containing protein [Nocardiopsis sp. NRRL B-16309]KOX11288.1 calcium-binding protein [Nocardiopsis sp. NRRL B-16309]
MTETSQYAATFSLVDTDGDGRISAGELADLIRRLGDECTEERAAEAVAAMDADHDDLISLAEFAAYMSRNQG